MRRRGRRALESLEDDLRDHLERETEENMARGMPPAEARRQAHITLGNVRALKEDVRQVWTWTSVEQFLADMRSGFQIVTRSPAISLTAITLIALVIGGNTTIFSSVHGLLRKPAPGITAHNLVSLGWSVGRQEIHPTDSYANYRDVAAEARSVRPLLAFQLARFTLTSRNGSYADRGALVTPNYFDTLGLELARGRSFTQDEAYGSALTAVISDRVWIDQFQRADSAIGATITLNGYPATIVGVAPPGFSGVWLGELSDVWVPIVAYARARGRLADLEQRAGGGIAMVGRLAQGASLPEARSEVSTIAERLQASYPDADKGRSIALFRYSATAAGDSVIAQRGSQFLAIFSIITALTLLIACANVANLMLARAIVRQREMAVRQSFGASRFRIVRLVVAEGMVVALAAWALACLLAWTLSKGLEHLIPPAANGGGRMVVDFTPDWTGIAYAMLLAAVATVAFTTAPALRTWRQDLLPFLKAGEQGIVRGRSRLATRLVILQLAFAVLLLSGAGLAYRSLSLIDTVDVGFDKAGLLLVTIDAQGVPATRRATLFDRMRDRLTGVERVIGVTYAQMAPQESWPTEEVRVAGAAQPIQVEGTAVGPDYLRVLGVTTRRGRGLVAEDRTRSVPAVVINDNLASALWPRQAAIGRMMLLGRDHHPVEVIGVASNALFSGFRREPRPYFVFLPMRGDAHGSGQATFYVRYTGALDPIAPAVTRILSQVDPRAAVVYMRTMETQLDSITSLDEILTILLTVFAAASLLIATLGQYAVLAFTMRRRIRDFGVRMALGASSRIILRGVVVEGLRMTALGAVIGCALSVFSGQAMRRLLFGVTPTDPSTYAGVVVVLAAASLIACYMPAWRASRIDPIQALRQE